MTWIWRLGALWSLEVTTEDGFLYPNRQNRIFGPYGFPSNYATQEWVWFSFQENLCFLQTRNDQTDNNITWMPIPSATWPGHSAALAAQDHSLTTIASSKPGVVALTSTSQSDWVDWASLCVSVSLSLSLSLYVYFHDCLFEGCVFVLVARMILASFFLLEFQSS